MLRSLLPVCLAAAVFLSACAEPPSKEMDQAQGALDAARAAGAEQYAPDTYTAAADALRRSQDAVTARDFRLALDNALTSREQAQNAAREAADTKARMRGEAESAAAYISARLALARTNLGAAREARVPARTLRVIEDQVAGVEGAVQEAGETIQAGDYLAAQAQLAAAREQIEKVLADLDEQVKSQAARRRR